ncbi:hypothetical protein [Desertimonas flava]|uniref:hypothetical protein n=1 Tax=Desertimonas flava TaxID=2064846 RepID=UPI000E354C5B|nr:hypothetical protein [Desertimonas flava]
MTLLSTPITLDPLPTVEDLKAKMLAEATQGTVEDPEDQWMGASAPYEMPAVPARRDWESTCSCCFLIKNAANLLDSVCSDCR